MGTGVPDLPSGGGYVDWTVRDTHDPASDQQNRTPAIAAPRNLWLSTVCCPVDLATKANPCLRIENTSKNKEDATEIVNKGWSSRVGVSQTEESVTLFKTELIQAEPKQSLAV